MKRDKSRSNQNANKTVEALAEVANLESQVAKLKAENSWLRNELERKRGLKQQLRDTYHSLDEAIIRRIDRRGMADSKDQKRLSPAIDIELFDSTNKKQLLRAALEYDVNTYFRYKKNPKAMKLKYRIASKLYRSARDTGIYGAKKARHLARRVR